MGKETTNRAFKFQRDLQKTENTFTEDVKPNRALQVRRDKDAVKTPAVTIEEIDTALITYINEIIKPSIVENGNIVPVAAIMASPEKWASIQLQGYLRDDKQKMMSPIIAIKRESMAPRSDLPKNKVLLGEGNVITTKKAFSQTNRYDKFSVMSDEVPVIDYFTIEVPDYVDISYNMIIWTDLVSQANRVTEAMTHWLGKAWGTTYKFGTKLESFSFETSNAPGGDRLIRVNGSFTVKGYLVPENIGKQTNLKRSLSSKRTVFKVNIEESGDKKLRKLPVTEEAFDGLDMPLGSPLIG